MKFKFENNCIKVKDVIKSNCINLLEELASEIESQTIKNSRNDTGDTVRHWKHIVHKKDLEAVIGNTLENSIWEENGTGEYAIKGDGRRGGWYIKIGDKKNAISLKTVKKYHFKIVYGKNGSKYAFTKGKKPTRAFFKAQRMVSELVEKLAKNNFGGMQ